LKNAIARYKKKEAFQQLHQTGCRSPRRCDQALIIMVKFSAGPIFWLIIPSEADISCMVGNCYLL